MNELEKKNIFMNETVKKEKICCKFLNERVKTTTKQQTMKELHVALDVHVHYSVGWSGNNIALQSFNGNTPSWTASSCMLSRYCFSYSAEKTEKHSLKMVSGYRPRASETDVKPFFNYQPSRQTKATKLKLFPLGIYHIFEQTFWCLNSQDL